jgi:hypothetical protein
MSSKVVDRASGAQRRPGGLVGGLLGRLSGALWWALLELFVLCGFVVTQPLLDVTGKAPDFFLFHRLGRGGIVALAVLIAVAPAVGLWLVQVGVGVVAGARVRRVVQVVMVTGLLWLLALEVGKKLLPLRGRRLVVAALLVGVVAGVGYVRWSGVRLWLRYLAPAPLVFVLVFGLLSPTSKLILPSRAGAGGAVPVRTGGGPLPPVVVVFFDEFPLQSLLDSRGVVDGRVYPSFAGFAAGSTWFRNATGVSGWTPYAVPAMLTGRYPDRSRRNAAPVAQVYPDNLFTMFGHYYNLKVSETISQLCPVRLCGQTGTQSRFGTVAKETAKLYKDIIWPADIPVDPAAVGDNPLLTADAQKKGPTLLFGTLKQDQLARLNRFVNSISAADPQPTLYFLHVLLPHAPWKYLPDGRVYNAGSLANPGVAGSIWPTALDQLNQKRHLLQLAYTDKVIGTLIRRLKDQGLYDRSLVLMTSDHGEGFTPGDRTRTLGPKNAADLMWVPLFIKAPHQTRGRVDDRNWEHVDLLPTIADIAGLSVPWKVDGFSQVGAPMRQRTDKWWYNHPGARLVRPGPPNWAKVLHGVTDTLIRAHQNGERGFYQYGATADWIYRPTRQVAPVGGAPVTVRIQDWGLFEQLDPRAPAVPSMVVGEVVSGTPPAGSTMVVAVNGRIGATSGFYPAKPGQPPASFAALLPDSLFQAGPGQPQLQLYLATGSGGAYRFQPVTVSG